MQRSNKILMIGLIVILSCANTAIAQPVRMKLDPFDEAKTRGVKVTDLDSVWVAIYGSDDVDVKEIKKKTLRLGTRNIEGAKARKKKKQDIDSDGHTDLLVRFKVSETGLRDAEDITAVLTGGLKSGREVFTAYDTFDKGGIGEDSCYRVSGDTKVGIRCELTKSATPLNLPELVAGINEALDAIGFGGTITNDSAVVTEMFGGEGHKGARVDAECKNVGSGGGRGYASSLFSLADLEAIAEDGQNLYAYVGEDGPANQNGGSSTVLMGQDIGSVTDALDPLGSKVIGIGAGGGGGGAANVGCEFDTCFCYYGFDGGTGGIAVGSPLGNISVAGQNGATKRKGQGGNQNGQGSGGDGPGENGTDGIGGFGSEAAARWAGSSASWANGKGGQGAGGGNRAGGGGGGFGGGSGAGSGNHKGGGGGGGGWARQETVLAAAVKNQLALGPAYDPGYPVAVLTFEVLPNE